MLSLNASRWYNTMCLVGGSLNVIVETTMIPTASSSRYQRKVQIA
jgi:hypothetical protein